MAASSASSQPMASTSVIPQGVGAPPPPGLDPKRGKLMCIKVRMLDDTVGVFHLGHKAVGQALFDEVCRHLNLLECDYFGLEFLDCYGNHCWLDKDKAILRQITSSQSDARFYFVVKFYSPNPADLEEEYTRYLFALQIKRDIATGQFLTNENTGALMSAYVVQSECGDYSVEDYPDHTYLSSVQFVPNQTPEFEKKVMENHKRLVFVRGMSPSESDLALLETARKCDFYGVKFHPARDIEGTGVNLAILHLGIRVYHQFACASTFSWAKIRKMSFKRKKFLIKLHPEAYHYYKDTIEFIFETRNESKAFWKKAVEHHTFFRCSEPSPYPIKNPGKLFSKGSSFKYNGRTQKQLIDYVREHHKMREPFTRPIHSSFTRSAYGGIQSSIGNQHYHQQQGGSLSDRSLPTPLLPMAARLNGNGNGQQHNGNNGQVLMGTSGRGGQMGNHHPSPTAHPQQQQYSPNNPQQQQQQSFNQHHAQMSEGEYVEEGGGSQGNRPHVMMGGGGHQQSQSSTMQRSSPSSSNTPVKGSTTISFHIPTSTPILYNNHQHQHHNHQQQQHQHQDIIYDQSEESDLNNAYVTASSANNHPQASASSSFGVTHNSGYGTVGEIIEKDVKSHHHSHHHHPHHNDSLEFHPQPYYPSSSGDDEGGGGVGGGGPTQSAQPIPISSSSSSANNSNNAYSTTQQHNNQHDFMTSKAMARSLVMSENVNVVAGNVAAARDGGRMVHHHQVSEGGGVGGTSWPPPTTNIAGYLSADNEDNVSEDSYHLSDQEVLPHHQSEAHHAQPKTPASPPLPQTPPLGRFQSTYPPSSPEASPKRVAKSMLKKQQSLPQQSSNEQVMDNGMYASVRPLSPPQGAAPTATAIVSPTHHQHHHPPVSNTSSAGNGKPSVSFASPTSPTGEDVEEQPVLVKVNAGKAPQKFTSPPSAAHHILPHARITMHEPKLDPIVTSIPSTSAATQPHGGVSSFKDPLPKRDLSYENSTYGIYETPRAPPEVMPKPKSPNPNQQPSIFQQQPLVTSPSGGGQQPKPIPPAVPEKPGPKTYGAIGPSKGKVLSTSTGGPVVVTAEPNKNSNKPVPPPKPKVTLIKPVIESGPRSATDLPPSSKSDHSIISPIADDSMTETEAEPPLPPPPPPMPSIEVHSADRPDIQHKFLLNGDVPYVLHMRHISKSQMEETKVEEKTTTSTSVPPPPPTAPKPTQSSGSTTENPLKFSTFKVESSGHPKEMSSSKDDLSRNKGPLMMSSGRGRAHSKPISDIQPRMRKKSLDLVQRKRLPSPGNFSSQDHSVSPTTPDSGNVLDYVLRRRSTSQELAARQRRAAKRAEQRRKTQPVRFTVSTNKAEHIGLIGKNGGSSSQPTLPIDGDYDSGDDMVSMESRSLHEDMEALECLDTASNRHSVSSSLGDEDDSPSSSIPPPPPPLASDSLPPLSSPSGPGDQAVARVSESAERAFEEAVASLEGAFQGIGDKIGFIDEGSAALSASQNKRESHKISSSSSGTVLQKSNQPHQTDF